MTALYMIGQQYLTVSIIAGFAVRRAISGLA